MNIRKFFGTLIVLVGLGVYVYPTVSSIYNEYVASKLISVYTSNNLTEEDTESMLKEAEEYNATLTTNQSVITTKNETTDSTYEGLLDVSGSIMGYIEIPKISQKLPIYHYTTSDSLSHGIGHIHGSSLPVGGTGTNAILTGHRGLPNSLLFTRLDEMELGDRFYVHVLDRDMVYEITDIYTVLPDEVESLYIDPDRDLVTLITCTPYGINTHRLVIVGERVELSEGEEIPTVSDLEVVINATPLTRLYVAGAVIIVFIGLQIFISIRQKKKAFDTEEKGEPV
jgi:sortase A